MDVGLVSQLMHEQNKTLIARSAFEDNCNSREEIEPPKAIFKRRIFISSSHRIALDKGPIVKTLNALSMFDVSVSGLVSLHLLR